MRPAARPALLALLGPLLLSALTACGGGDASAVSGEVAMTVAPDPPKVGPATLDLAITSGGDPLTGATVKVEGNMAHAGMVPVFADATETDPGTYRATLDLTMAGDWFVLVDATLPDGRRLERKVDLPGVRPK